MDNRGKMLMEKHLKLNSDAELVVIYGPMFAGKTTKLIEFYDKHKNSDNCIALNYALDTRFCEEDKSKKKKRQKIISHDGMSIDSYFITDLGEFTRTHSKILDVEYVFINEAQFFPNLLKNVLFIKNILGINVILCGLDLDYRRQPFGELLDLLPYATETHKLSGLCAVKGCRNRSLYSQRLVTSDELVLIGGTDEYIPICGDCYQ